jgi:hypothetical protein
MLKKIIRLENEIKQKVEEYEQDKLKLPQRPKGPNCPPGATRQGHIDKINELREILKNRNSNYKRACSDPPDDPPLDSKDSHLLLLIMLLLQAAAAIGAGGAVGAAPGVDLPWELPLAS